MKLCNVFKRAIALKKTSEDGVVAGIPFTIKGEGVNKTVTTDKDGNLTVEGLFPSTYTITEQAIDRYEPQQTRTVTLIGGKTTTVNFNNTLKRGSLEVIKTSEDSLVEGVTFHLYGTSLSGLAVDEYAATDAKGVARFENILISGDSPYVLEEVDTAIPFVVPASQTAPIEWKKVTGRSFTNILKKFNVTVTKTDKETGTPQGDASLAGAVYGIYKGEMHRDYLEQHKRVTYLNLLTSGNLNAYLYEVEQTSLRCLELLTKQLLAEQGVTEELKEKAPMQWVGLMNNIRNQAEEMILNELIYS